MPSSTGKSAFLRGMRDALPFIIILVPFALMFGIVSREAGLNVAQIMAFTALVVAGAAQFTAVQLMIDDAPTVVVLITSLAVNLRMAMYSAAMVPHLGDRPMWQRALLAYVLVDQIFATSAAEYERRPEMGGSEKIAFFFGMATVIAPVWYLSTYIGAVTGAELSADLDITIALPITFLAMVGPMLRTLAHTAAALTSVILAVVLAGLPAGTGLLVAGIVAMVVGGQVEYWQAARR